jgi:hypothetical protein
MPNDRPRSCFPHGVKGVTFCGKSDASNRYTAARACQEDSRRWTGRSILKALYGTMKIIKRNS